MQPEYSPEYLRKLKEEKLRRKQEEKYRYYTPIGKVEEFYDKLFSGDYLTGLLSAANGIGKTTAMINALCHLFWPCENEYFQQPLMIDWPFLKKGRIVSDSTTITETIIPMIKEWFPPGSYTLSKRGKHYESHCQIHDSEWEFDLMTYNQEVTEFESANLGWCFFDEPPDKPIYIATVARMRRGGIIGIFATPLSNTGAWMHDEIVANKDIAKAKYSFSITATVFDASIAKGVRGFLKMEDIRRMIAQYDDEDKHARIFGKFQHLVGLVFKKFEPTVHVITPFHMREEDYVVVELIDPHPRNPDAVLWVAKGRNDIWYVIDELFMKGRTGEIAERIKEKREGKRIVAYIGDPSMFTKDKHDDRALAEDFGEYDLFYTPGSKRRTDAIRRIKDALNWKKKGDTWEISPVLFIFDRCRRLIWEMQHWQWSEWSAKARVNKDRKEKPVDKDDHEIENLGRALLANVPFEEMERYVPEPNTALIDSNDPYD